MDVRCKHCNTLHWLDERLANSSVKNPLFGSCCLQGKVSLSPLSPLPPPIQSLYEGSDALSRSFREFIRSYNAVNAFSSLGVKINDRVLNGCGPSSFTIHGQLHHNVGSLLPEPDKDPKYAQLYIYDAFTAQNYRQQRNPHLRKDVLDIVQ
ncbi:DNA helicase [Ranunculus cassubicifolius]